MRPRSPPLAAPQPLTAIDGGVKSPSFARKGARGKFCDIELNVEDMLPGR